MRWAGNETKLRPHTFVAAALKTSRDISGAAVHCPIVHAALFLEVAAAVYTAAKVCVHIVPRWSDC